MAETVVAEFPMEIKVFGDHPGQSGHQYEEIGDRGDSADGNEKAGLYLCENELGREGWGERTRAMLQLNFLDAYCMMMLVDCLLMKLTNSTRTIRYTFESRQMNLVDSLNSRICRRTSCVAVLLTGSVSLESPLSEP